MHKLISSISNTCLRKETSSRSSNSSIRQEATTISRTTTSSNSTSSPTFRPPTCRPLTFRPPQYSQSGSSSQALDSFSNLLDSSSSSLWVFKHHNKMDLRARQSISSSTWYRAISKHRRRPSKEKFLRPLNPRQHHNLQPARN